LWLGGVMIGCGCVGL